MTSIRAGDIWQHVEKCACGNKGQIFIKGKGKDGFLEGELVCCGGKTLIIPDIFVQHAALKFAGKLGPELWRDSAKTSPYKEDQQDDWAKMMDELEAWIQADEGTPEMVDMLNWEPPGKEKETKCECGSDKVGSPYHSKWCPKHEK